MTTRSIIEVRYGGETYTHPIETIDALDRAFQRAVMGFNDTLAVEAQIVSGHGQGTYLIRPGEMLRIDDFAAWRRHVFGDIPPPSKRVDRYSFDRLFAECEGWRHLALGNAKLIRAWRTVDSAMAKSALEDIAAATDQLVLLETDPTVLSMASGRL